MKKETAMIHAKLAPSIEKVFRDSSYAEVPTLTHLYAYRNQLVSFQIVLHGDCWDPHRSWLGLKIEGIPEEAVTLRDVDMIPVQLPVTPGSFDAGYLRTTPGLYPDLLSPIQMGGMLRLLDKACTSVWVDVDMTKIPTQKKTYDIKANFNVNCCDHSVDCPLTITALPANLPEIDFKVTQWFHCDCLANYYHCESFDERHWRIIENFMKTAVKNGINMILTPIFTPPLDTAHGGERRTTQLIGVRRFANGKYKFDFTLLDRWIETANRAGVKYLEISHMFTQWGAEHAPKIMATTPNGYEKIFGWDTDATGREYKHFLQKFVPALVEHLKARGDDKRCVYHISDEPHGSQIKQYMKAKAIVAPYLKDYMFIDALSDENFYKEGIIPVPVAATDNIDKFIEAFREKNDKGLWAYYCCGQNRGVSNRYYSMSGARTRFIGFQFYKYDIAGFLQWGYNFYNNQFSCDPINPYVQPSGNYFVPAGDMFSVYPGMDETALESIRINYFREGLDDLRALKLCESFIGKDATLAAAEEIAGNITFGQCVNETTRMMALREKIDSIVAEHLK